MLKKWLNKIEWQLVVVLFVLAFIILANFSTSTYLSGWDNLHPEFDFSLNFWRAFSGVWVENEGVGTTLGHGFSASLPHTIFLWLMSLIIPKMYLRSLFVLLMYAAGVTGVYKLVKRIFGKNEFRLWGAMIGSLFYALNLGTVQTFFSPLEAFVIMYGLLPWVMLTIGEYLHKPTKKKLIIVLITQILFSSIGFIPPLFIAYGFLLSGMLLSYLWKDKHNFISKLKQIILVGGIIILTNLYWLMPLVSYSLNSSQTYVEAKNNQLSTPDFQHMSEARGKITDTIILRGFFIDSADLVIEENEVFYQIFKEWNEHLLNIEWIGYIMFVFVVLGLVGIKRNNVDEYWYGGVIVSFVAGFVILTQGEDVFAKTIDIVKDIPVIGQAFRAAWTKFSGILMLAYSILIPFGIWILIHWIKKFKHILLLLVTTGIMIFGWPIFQGKLTYSKLKVNTPDEYFNLFEFMKTQDTNSKIANLPIAWNWGWETNNWGYRGSGFLWYGIKQPILDRAFDVWSPYNETFYNELSTAIYGCTTEIDSKCTNDVSSVLSKYDVKYILLDESVIIVGQDEKVLRISETKNIAKKLGWEEVFQEEFLTVWKLPIKQNSGVTAPSEYSWIKADTSKVRQDVTYINSQHAVISGQGKKENTIIYPFANLMQEEVKVEYLEEKIILRSSLTELPTKSELKIPGFNYGEIVEIKYKLKVEQEIINIEWEPIYLVNGQEGPKLQSQSFQLGSQYLSSVGKAYKETLSLWQIQIGNNEAVFIEEGKQVNETAKLVVGAPIEIKIYDEIVEKENKIMLVNEQKCGENDEYTCYTIPLDKQSTDSLLQTTTTYKEGMGPEICLNIEGDPYKCVNTKIVGKNPVVITTMVKEDKKIWLNYVLRDKKTILYDPVVKWHELLGSKTINQELWEGWNEEQLFYLHSHDLEVEIIGNKKVYDFNQIGRSEASNCDVLKRGSVQREKISKLNPGINYKANEYGSNCDYVLMRDLDTRMSYLIRMQGENLAGRSLKLFLHNTGSERNDLEYLLPAGKFDQTFSTLSWEYLGSYNLNIETRSFGQYAENILNPVEIRYVPLNVIAHAKLQTSSDNKIQNNLEIKNVKKMGTWLYRIDIQNRENSKQINQGLIKLSQGFDNGWIAYIYKTNIRGMTQLEHVKINRWSNGWIIENEELEFNELNKKIVIFYWPQLLEYLGFIMLGITILVIWKKSEITKINKNNSAIKPKSNLKKKIQKTMKGN